MKLIDLGTTNFNFFLGENDTHILAMENQLRPITALKVDNYNRGQGKYDDKDQWSASFVKSPLPHLKADPKFKDLWTAYDVREIDLWKLGVMIFEVLHSRSPWEEADEDQRPHLLVHDYLSVYVHEMRTYSRPMHPQLRQPYEWTLPAITPQDVAQARDARRNRIVNDPLPIDPKPKPEPKPKKRSAEEAELDSTNGMGHDAGHDISRLRLTQDCHDLLTAMFQKDEFNGRMDQTNRPDMDELVTYPWLQGSYLDYEDGRDGPVNENHELDEGEWDPEPGHEITVIFPEEDRKPTLQRRPGLIRAREDNHVLYIHPNGNEHFSTFGSLARTEELVSEVEEGT